MMITTQFAFDIFDDDLWSKFNETEKWNEKKMKFNSINSWSKYVIYFFFLVQLRINHVISS